QPKKTPRNNCHNQVHGRFSQVIGSVSTATSARPWREPTGATNNDLAGRGGRTIAVRSQQTSLPTGLTITFGPIVFGVRSSAPVHHQGQRAWVTPIIRPLRQALAGRLGHRTQLALRHSVRR